MKKIYYLSILLVSLLNSCYKPLVEPELINEEEVITTVILSLESTSGSVTFSYVDLDGDGPQPAVKSHLGTLKSHTLYSGQIQLLNETVNPSEDITEEVKEEGTDHQFFFENTSSNAVFTPTDLDENSNPIGIEFELQTGESTTEKLYLILRHLPTKPNDGTAANAGGETDLSVLFEFEIED